MSFDARHTKVPIPPALNPTPYPASLAPAKVPPGVLAKVGETFAVALSALQGSLSTLGALTPAQQVVLDSALG